MTAKFCNLILEAFLLKIPIIFLCQYAKFSNAAYKNVHLDLIQSFLKIKLKAHIQLSKKFVNKLCSLFLPSLELTILSSSNILCLIMKM